MNFNDRSKFKIKGIGKLVFLIGRSQFLLMAIEFLRFVNN